MTNNSSQPSDSMMNEFACNIMKLIMKYEYTLIWHYLELISMTYNISFPWFKCRKFTIQIAFIQRNVSHANLTTIFRLMKSYCILVIQITWKIMQQLQNQLKLKPFIVVIILNIQFPNSSLCFINFIFSSSSKIGWRWKPQDPRMMSQH